jgi:hypothetical protein
MVFCFDQKILHFDEISFKFFLLGPFLGEFKDDIINNCLTLPEQSTILVFQRYRKNLFCVFS